MKKTIEHINFIKKNEIHIGLIKKMEKDIEYTRSLFELHNTAFGNTVYAGSVMKFRTINIMLSSKMNWEEASILHKCKITACIITLPYSEKSFVGFSFCSPKDIYCKIRGQYIAMKRCLSHSLDPLEVDNKDKFFSIKQACISESKRLCIRWMSEITEDNLC